MSLRFYPPSGTILICDYSTGFQPPEMVKRRPVVVVSPRFRNRRDLCTIVPLSSTPPRPVERYHHRLSDGAYPPGRSVTWAKCDMINTVALARLDRIKVRTDGGHRGYTTYAMPDPDMEQIMLGIRYALGLLDA